LTVASTASWSWANRQADDGTRGAEPEGDRVDPRGGGAIAAQWSEWDVTITSDRVPLSGRIYVPLGVGPDERRPGALLVGTPPLTKEVGLPRYAQALAMAGLIALSFDYSWGEGNGGEGRPSLDTYADDARRGLAYLAARRDVLPDSLAALGMGLGAAVLTMLAAFEPRLRALAFVAGVLSYRSAMASLLGEAEAARHARHVQTRLGNGEMLVPVFGARDPLVMFPGEEPFRILDRITRTASPRFRNRVPAAVLAQWLDLHAGTFARQLPPRPMLFLQGQQDRMSPPTAAAALVQSLGEGALTEWVASRHHFEFYDGSRPAGDAADATARWLAARLNTEAPRQDVRGRGGRRLSGPAARRQWSSPGLDR
jgi:hypothetical protein